MDLDYAPYKSLSCLFYDTLKGYASAAEIQAYRDLMPAHTQTILEAMCGSGRLLIPLVKQGYIVEGIDTSTAMLDRCRDRSKQERVAVSIYNQPLQEFTLSNRYEVITIAVGSFQLITDHNQAVQALTRMKEHLKPGGAILIDTFMPDLKTTRLDPRKAHIDSSTHIMLYTRYLHDPDTQIVQALNEYELIQEGVVTQTEFEILPVIWRTPDQWQMLCAQAGLTILGTYPTSFRPALNSAIMKLAPSQT